MNRLMVCGGQLHFWSQDALELTVDLVGSLRIPFGVFKLFEVPYKFQAVVHLPLDDLHVLQLRQLLFASMLSR